MFRREIYFTQESLRYGVLGKGCSGLGLGCGQPVWKVGISSSPGLG